MVLLQHLSDIWAKEPKPIIICKGKEIYFRDLRNVQNQNLDLISKGDVVALIGDYDPQTSLPYKID